MTIYPEWRGYNFIVVREQIWLPRRWRRLSLAGSKQQRFIAALMRMIRDTIRSDLLPEQRSTVTAWLRRTWLRLARFLIGESDPNDQRLQGGLAEGLCEIPLSTF